MLPQGELRLDLRDIELLPLQPYFSEFLNITVTRGQIAAKGTLSLNPAKEGVAAGCRATLTLGNFHTVDKANSADFLKWKSFYFGNIDVQDAAAQHRGRRGRTVRFLCPRRHQPRRQAEPDADRPQGRRGTVANAGRQAAEAAAESRRCDAWPKPQAGRSPPWQQAGEGSGADQDRQGDAAGRQHRDHRQLHQAQPFGPT